MPGLGFFEHIPHEITAMCMSQLDAKSIVHLGLTNSFFNNLSNEWRDKVHNNLRDINTLPEHTNFFAFYVRHSEFTIKAKQIVQKLALVAEPLACSLDPSGSLHDADIEEMRAAVSSLSPVNKKRKNTSEKLDRVRKRRKKHTKGLPIVPQPLGSLEGKFNEALKKEDDEACRQLLVDAPDDILVYKYITIYVKDVLTEALSQGLDVIARQIFQELSIEDLVMMHYFSSEDIDRRICLHNYSLAPELFFRGEIWSSIVKQRRLDLLLSLTFVSHRFDDASTCERFEAAMLRQLIKEHWFDGLRFAYEGAYTDKDTLFNSVMINTSYKYQDCAINLSDSKLSKKDSKAILAFFKLLSRSQLLTFFSQTHVLLAIARSQNIRFLKRLIKLVPDNIKQSIILSEGKHQVVFPYQGLSLLSAARESNSSAMFDFVLSQCTDETIETIYTSSTYVFHLLGAAYKYLHLDAFKIFFDEATEKCPLSRIIHADNSQYRFYRMMDLIYIYNSPADERNINWLEEQMEKKEKACFLKLKPSGEGTSEIEELDSSCHSSDDSDYYLPTISCSLPIM